jgi:hypothetical protein
MTSSVVGSSVFANQIESPFWVDAIRRSSAADLMHQQLYAVGRDIESKHGNLLLRYGSRKTCSPNGCAVSLYSFRLAGGYRLLLRGFGVFIGSDRIGGLFLHRYEMEPRWMPSSRFEPIAWLPQDMPRTRKVRRTETDSALDLVNQLTRFFCGYEVWIRENFGKRHRATQLVAFRRMGNENVQWDTVKAWESLC